jgi:transposase
MDTGEFQERRLEHREEAEKFYRDLGAQNASVRVGMEASGHARWFERSLSELRFDLWIGDAAEIRTKRVRKPATLPHQTSVRRAAALDQGCPWRALG